ncbi:DUF2975 domain-containing protein [Bifidobacterium avesanii]|uniref:DUF2975 domain-containing protein n=1 Tax=Bifidobacterium avesanii TaxID=1798157 RepID=A0A7K3TGK6_9BIFI|nr:DUF2975 domain-containing protein [Bifidobacterium avesanii]KAB8295397.1 hypothetical protein DSM100685_0007 [Bifidobacterium avesanii]NEG77403.1 DUF2975 domain-containing protein [Bifidobacterium avesanii]
MSQYVSIWALRALKGFSILAWLACAWGQLVAVPALSEAMAGLYPSQTPMRWPYVVMGALLLLCVEVAFVGVWRLLSLSGSGAVFTAKALPCVNLIIGCAAAATVLTAAVLGAFAATAPGDATMQAMDYWSVVTVLGVGAVAGVGFTLLMVVMRGLLRAATDQSDELGQVI